MFVERLRLGTDERHVCAAMSGILTLSTCIATLFYGSFDAQQRPAAMICGARTVDSGCEVRGAIGCRIRRILKF
jgi:hypothetical protein